MQLQEKQHVKDLIPPSAVEDRCKPDGREGERMLNFTAHHESGRRPYYFGGARRVVDEYGAITRTTRIDRCSCEDTQECAAVSIIDDMVGYVAPDSVRPLDARVSVRM